MQLLSTDVKSSAKRNTLAGIAMALGVVVATVITSLPGSAEARSRGGHHFGGHHKQDGLLLTRLAFRLDLSDEQKDAIDVLVEAVQPQVDELRNERRAHGEELWSLVQSGGDNEAAIQETAEALGAVATELAVIKTQIRVDVYHKVLTSEQQAQLDERLAEQFSDDETEGADQ